MKIEEKLLNLRKLMKENEIDAYIVPSADYHLSEYVAEYFKCRQWISGFTGSAGTVVVTMTHAGLWTDGRYYIQAEKQLKGTEIKLFRMVDPGVPSVEKWLSDTLEKGSVVGIDGRVVSFKNLRGMKKQFSLKEINININIDLISKIWEDRPAIPEEKVFLHDDKYAGKSRADKINEIRKEMDKKKATHYLVTSLDDIAWTLNLRGNDVPCNPVFLSNLLITLTECYLFVDKKKVQENIAVELLESGITIKDYEETFAVLKSLTEDEALLFDPSATNAYLIGAINDSVKLVEEDNITTALKSIKNDTEIKNWEDCQVSDGVAMVKFIKWLKDSVKKGIVTEISASDKLEEFRGQGNLFAGISFDTIAGYKEHAAMMHYKATEESDYTLKAEGFFLVDSGGQYFNGTTDITRTFVLGDISEEERKDFTLVLKANIALSSVKFLYGATGSNLDIIARQPIWKYGLDYKCGTGHGVGFFLNVHEGPQRLSQVPNSIKLEKGMILTNEPGIYKEGKHGIRTENMMVVAEDEKTEFGQFMRFDIITYCPIDLEGIDPEMLAEEEKKWLNDYHKTVYKKLYPFLNQEEKQWLKYNTREI
ncbi:aminopeptidase P family protein [Clostridium sp. 19966]|uniref:aminopeptidase P family protein n=1 Tax=Clostridium sp. 19966 TaxID=2768166 RepID=UPI0028DFD07B|nr:aminopeptidase P family protein [Clostridium sp. 19966]MDT8717434.1 aminopeptidase P family protein [Clostridium sp. 19966]